MFTETLYVCARKEKNKAEEGKIIIVGVYWSLVLLTFDIARNSSPSVYGFFRVKSRRSNAVTTSRSTSLRQRSWLSRVSLCLHDDITVASSPHSHSTHHHHYHHHHHHRHHHHHHQVVLARVTKQLEHAKKQEAQLLENYKHHCYRGNENWATIATPKQWLREPQS